MFTIKWFSSDLINTETNEVYITLYLPRIYDQYNTLITCDLMCYTPTGAQWAGDENMPPVSSTEFAEIFDLLPWME